MCGIIAGLSKTNSPINKAVWKRYIVQKGRGSEGFGFATVENGKVVVYRAEGEEEILKLIKKHKSQLVLFHHRYPTSTINCIEATHPIFVSHEELDYDYYVIHNGVIQNDEFMKKEHEKLGYKYNTVIKEREMTEYRTVSEQVYTYYGKEKETFNDSEAFAIDLVRKIDGMSSKMDSIGTIAFICYQVEKSTQKLVSLCYGHNSGNPLHIEEDNNVMFIKSVGGKELDTDVLFKLDVATGITTETKMDIGQERYRYTPTTQVISTVNNHWDDEYGYNKYHNSVGFRIPSQLEWEKELEEMSAKYGSEMYQSELLNNDDISYATPYGTMDSKEETRIKGWITQYVSLMDNRDFWLDYVETETETLNYEKDHDTKEKIRNSILDANQEANSIMLKMDEIEEKFVMQYGEAIDFQDLVEEQLTENVKIPSIYY